MATRQEKNLLNNSIEQIKSSKSSIKDEVLTIKITIIFLDNLNQLMTLVRLVFMGGLHFMIILKKRLWHLNLAYRLGQTKGILY